MAATKPQVKIDNKETARLELYRLLGEGFRAVQEGRTSTNQEVKDRIKKRRSKNG